MQFGYYTIFCYKVILLDFTRKALKRSSTVYCFVNKKSLRALKGVLHPWALFLKTLCILSQNKATSDKVFYGSGQKCSKELKNHSFTSVETIVVKLQ